jgi:hypothetical protein
MALWSFLRLPLKDRAEQALRPGGSSVSDKSVGWVNLPFVNQQEKALTLFPFLRFSETSPGNLTLEVLGTSGDGTPEAYLYQVQVFFYGTEQNVSVGFKYYLYDADEEWDVTKEHCAILTRILGHHLEIVRSEYEAAVREVQAPPLTFPMGLLAPAPPEVTVPMHQALPAPQPVFSHAIAPPVPGPVGRPGGVPAPPEPQPVPMLSTPSHYPVLPTPQPLPAVAPESVGAMATQPGQLQHTYPPLVPDYAIIPVPVQAPAPAMEGAPRLKKRYRNRGPELPPSSTSKRSKPGIGSS